MTRSVFVCSFVESVTRFYDSHHDMSTQVNSIRSIRSDPHVSGVVVESVVEPVLGPVVEPVLGPVVEPVLGPVVEPVLGPVLGPVVEPVLGPVVEPVLGPVVEPLAVYTNVGIK